VLGPRTLLVAAVVGFAATGLSACGTGESVATHAPRTTLTAGQSAQLVSDERAWTTAQNRWIAITEHCLRWCGGGCVFRSSSASATCRRVRSSYLRRQALVNRAMSDVLADAATLGGSSSPTVHTCKSRLLHYRSVGGVGGPLAQAMHYAKLSLQDGLNGISQVTSASRTVVSAARAAEAACSP
jgi:hypothetical protein